MCYRPSSVGGCDSDSAVTEMHFKQLGLSLYNCIRDSDVSDSVLQRISDGLADGSKVSISVWDIVRNTC